MSFHRGLLLVDTGKILQDKESAVTRFAFPSANLIVLKSMTLDLSKETLTIIIDKI